MMSPWQQLGRLTHRICRLRVTEIRPGPSCPIVDLAQLHRTRTKVANCRSVVLRTLGVAESMRSELLACRGENMELLKAHASHGSMVIELRDNTGRTLESLYTLRRHLETTAGEVHDVVAGVLAQKCRSDAASTQDMECRLLLQETTALLGEADRLTNLAAELKRWRRTAGFEAWSQARPYVGND